MKYERARSARSSIPLSERELWWARRESRPAPGPWAERLEHEGFVPCPGAFGAGCLVMIPLGSGRLLCYFCTKTVRLLTIPLGPGELRALRGKRQVVPGVLLP